MKPLYLNFYHLSDVIAADGKTVHYHRLATATPVDSVKITAQTVFRSHLSYAGFTISRFRPDLENTTLEVEICFKESGGTVIPVLTASHHGVFVADKEISTQTIDAQPYMSALIKRRPALENAVLVYNISDNDGREKF